MKIPLDIENHRLVLPAAVFSRSSGIIIRVEFLVDTGAREAFLCTGDTLDLRIPRPNGEPFAVINIGGERFSLISIPDLEICFPADERPLLIAPEKFSVPKEAWSEPSKNSKVPSIIGMKFLKEQALSLIVRPHKNIAYLETDN